VIGSFNFRVGSLGSLRLSDLIYSGPSTSKTIVAATSETSVGSSSEANSSVSIKPVESGKNIDKGIANKAHYLGTPGAR
jgi:hypothetical protein